MNKNKMFHPVYTQNAVCTKRCCFPPNRPRQVFILTHSIKITNTGVLVINARVEQVLALLNQFFKWTLTQSHTTGQYQSPSHCFSI